MSLLESVQGPADLKRMKPSQLEIVAGEIRGFLVDRVRRTGGHLGPNLGVVELTLALHRVFDSPRDAIIWDVGHQSYVHKIVTGRQKDFDHLRQAGGLTGYPSRAESEHDFVENSHASTALSYVDGLAKAFQFGNEKRHAIAVVGDGALTGGMCWEALNNIAAGPRRPIVIVVNDNGRSYSPTIGGLADHLAALRVSPNYERLLDKVRALLRRLPLFGGPMYTALHAAKAGVKDAVSPQRMFSDLGLKYLGPIDGHDIAALEKAFSNAKAFGGPVIVHAVTKKGHGYEPAVNHQADHMHQMDAIDPETGIPPLKKKSWTTVFGDELAQIGRERSDVVAVTAAMMRSTGLQEFADEYPDRCFDVGIAEQHAITSAAGMAMGGMHPVVAIYSTFINRAYDQLLMDVALHRQPVTMVLDRAGITGPDGPSHHGMWDLSLLATIPGMRVAAPRDEDSLREELREAVSVADGPTALRFPRGGIGQAIPAIDRIGHLDVIFQSSTVDNADSVDASAKPDLLLIPVGGLAEEAVSAASQLSTQGIDVSVVDPRWIFPISSELTKLAAQYRRVMTIEDSGSHGGFGATLSSALRAENCVIPLRHLGIPQQFIEHNSREQLLAELGLNADGIVRSVLSW